MTSSSICEGEAGQKEGWVAASRLVTSGITAYHHSAKIKSMLREKKENTVGPIKVSLYRGGVNCPIVCSINCIIAQVVKKDKGSDSSAKEANATLSPDKQALKRQNQELLERLHAAERSADTMKKMWFVRLCMCDLFRP